MIVKDKKYYTVYLAAIILEIILVCLSIVFVLFVIIKSEGMESAYKIILAFFSVMAFLLSLFGLSLGTLSMRGYLSIPDVLIEIKDELIVNLDNNKTINLKREDIKSIEKGFALFSRSSYYINIETKNSIYQIKDVYRINESIDELKKWYNESE